MSWGVWMHVGMSAIFQGFGGSLSDREVWAADLRLADLAEPLGFDSIWSVEHHFTDYTMCPDVLQFLTYMAGRTSTVKLGSMVLVLPWHDPVRAAEQIVMLDHMSNGRLILGLGRGTGRIEFDGFRVYMGQARQQFKEAAEAILIGLETGIMEYEGEYVHQPRVELRPAPLKSFKGRTYSATVSPESAEIMAKIGTGVLIVPQKPWHLVEEETATYRATYREARGEEPPPPIVAGWTFVDENADRAEEQARTWLAGYWDSVIYHYEFDKPHLKETPGYEFHGLMYDRLQQPGGPEKMTEFYIGLQPWGTPEQVYEKSKTFCDLIGADGFVGVFRYGGMPVDVAERSMRLFAREVMPELQNLAPAVDRLAHLYAAG
jgi:alkanesulfonate monooxygenase SsuD/methylene tetrahydromethanopterin reductase-like flavin-dependent oxidoreductase (luciferase family)